eukprot:6207040-Pleurochrysis_carterae.AAC.1
MAYFATSSSAVFTRVWLYWMISENKKAKALKLTCSKSIEMLAAGNHSNHDTLRESTHLMLPPGERTVKCLPHTPPASSWSLEVGQLIVVRGPATAQSVQPFKCKGPAAAVAGAVAVSPFQPHT